LLQKIDPDVSSEENTGLEGRGCLNGTPLNEILKYPKDLSRMLKYIDRFVLCYKLIRVENSSEPFKTSPPPFRINTHPNPPRTTYILRSIRIAIDLLGRTHSTPPSLSSITQENRSSEE